MDDVELRELVPRVLSVLVSRGADFATAEDAVQEALVAAWVHIRAVRDPDRFDAWLRRLVVNSCIDLTRRRRRRAIEVELSPLDSHRPGDGPPPSPGTSP